MFYNHNDYQPKLISNITAIVGVHALLYHVMKLSCNSNLAMSTIKTM
jgi:hypothetical protein